MTSIEKNNQAALDKLNAAATACGMAVGDGKAPIDTGMGKLAEGVGLILVGVIKLLSALDVNAAQPTGTEPSTGAEAQPGAAATTEVQSPAVQSDPQSASQEETLPWEEKPAWEETRSAEPEPQPASGSVPPAAQQQPAAQPPQSSLTADDITKVIVRKIKQNRSNSQKIGAILKTFGVTKVSELPTGQYEAFLTELSQL